jgi:hypothetical protein
MQDTFPTSKHNCIGPVTLVQDHGAGQHAPLILCADTSHALSQGAGPCQPLTSCAEPVPCCAMLPHVAGQFPHPEHYRVRLVTFLPGQGTGQCQLLEESARSTAQPGRARGHRSACCVEVHDGNALINGSVYGGRCGSSACRTCTPLFWLISASGPP